MSKFQLRHLLATNDGGAVSPSTFWRLCKKWELAEKLGMTPEEFRDTKNFYLDHYLILKDIFKFNDNDLI